MKRHISIGPGSASLILIIVVLAMSLLATLTFSSARNDLRLTQRSAAVAQRNYRLYDSSERTLARAVNALMHSSELPQGVVWENDLLRWTESEDGFTLQCAARVLIEEDGFSTEWIEHKLFAEVDSSWY